MANLLPIGQFSRACRLSVKALRHYDDLDLLRPAVTDPSSGYRYYTYAQAARAEAIRVLRSLDMPLSEIREVLDADGELRTKLLARHRERLQAELDRRQRTLAFLQRLINSEEGLMAYQVTVKQIPAQHVALIRRHTTFARIGEDIRQGFALVAEAVQRQGVAFGGPPFLVMHDVMDADTGGDIEVGFPVAAPFGGSGDVVGAEHCAMTVAAATHRGPYEEIAPAYHGLAEWVQEHGHETAGPPREVYLTDPTETPDPADYLTEVQFPIR